MPSLRPTLLLFFAALQTALHPGPARADEACDPRADCSHPKALDLYRAAGERYLESFRRDGEEACARRQPGCEKMEEVLDNAARAFQAARDIPRSIAVRQILIDPKYNLHTTNVARNAVYEIAGMYQSMAEYDEAAAWYERYAAASPKLEHAREALSDAVALRLGLGQDDKAARDAELYNKHYGSSKPAETARVTFAVAATLVEQERWPEARKRLTAALGQIDRNGALDVRIQAHAMLGRVIEKLDGPAKAAIEYEVVRTLWKDPAAAVRRIQSETSDDRRLGKALTALGEALFFFAEEKRNVAEAIRLPAYTGSGRREDISEHTAKKLGPAMAARRRAIAEAERAYVAVLDIQPAPPPRWVIASAARVARMHGRLAAEIRALPAPKAWKAQDEVRAVFRAALLDASEPDHQRAYAAARRCQDLSVKFQWVHESTRSCAAWLERHYPNEHPRLDEIAPAPRHVAAGLDPRGKPEPDPRAP